MVRIGKRERQVRADKRLSITAPRTRHRHYDRGSRAVHVQDVEPDAAERLDHGVRALRSFLVGVPATRGHDTEHRHAEMLHLDALADGPAQAVGQDGARGAEYEADEQPEPEQLREPDPGSFDRARDVVDDLDLAGPYGPRVLRFLIFD